MNYTGEAGFSLVEILVVIAMTGIIVWLTFSIYLFGQRYFIDWEQKLHLQNELHVLIQGITEDVYRAERIVAFENDKLVLEMSNHNERIYHVKDDTLFRNKQKLAGGSISLVKFQIIAQDQESQQLTGLDQIEAGKVTLFNISLSLTNERDTLSVAHAVHLRKPANWNTL